MSPRWEERNMREYDEDDFPLSSECDCRVCAPPEGPTWAMVIAACAAIVLAAAIVVVVG